MGQLTNAKPCKSCCYLIRQIPYLRHVYYTDANGVVHRENANTITSSVMAAGMLFKKRGQKPIFYKIKSRPTQQEHISVDIDYN